MSFVPINYRVQQFISAMSGSVLVAVLTPLAVNGDNGARLALLSTAVVMLLVKSRCRRLRQALWQRRWCGRCRGPKGMWHCCIRCTYVRQRRCIVVYGCAN